MNVTHNKTAPLTVTIEFNNRAEQEALWMLFNYTCICEPMWEIGFDTTRIQRHLYCGDDYQERFNDLTDKIVNHPAMCLLVSALRNV
jgi:hypothetical protein